MPFEWVEPELAVEYKNKKVYHTYKNDKTENKQLYWYTTDPQGVDGYDNFAFDIRDFEYPGYIHTRKERLCYLIDMNRLAFPNYMVN